MVKCAFIDTQNQTATFLQEVFCLVVLRTKLYFAFDGFTFYLMPFSFEHSTTLALLLKMTLKYSFDYHNSSTQPAYAIHEQNEIVSPWNVDNSIVVIVWI